jgi:peptidoglycan/LPS O-acetylase OafA/YrhL
LLRHGDIYFGNRLYESYLAVDFFFALSGFVIMHAYGQKIASGEMPILEFMSRRIIRLYPLYIFSIIFAAILAICTKEHTVNLSRTAIIIEVFLAALFVPNTFNALRIAFPLNLPSWSLYCEYIGNFVFAIVLKRFGMRGIAGFVASSALVLIWAVLNRRLGFGLFKGSGVLDNGFQSAAITAGLARVSFSFFFGALLYQLWRRRVNPTTCHPLVISATLFALLAARPPTAIQPIYDLVTTMIMFPLLIWLAAGSKSTGFLTRVFDVLGISSYGIYVMQIPFYQLSLILRDRLPFHVNPIVFGALTVASLFLFVLFLDRYYDLPLRKKWMRSLTKTASLETKPAPLPSA